MSKLLADEAGIERLIVNHGDVQLMLYQLMHTETEGFQDEL